MVIKTKKYQLPTNTYIRIGFQSIMIDLWWVWLIPVAIMLVPIFYPPAFGWCLGIAITLIVLYLLFWLIQFSGMTQLEQGKFLFERMSYEIDSRQILLKINNKQGMPLSWDQVKKVKKAKNHYIIVLSKVQFIYLPFKIFRSEHEMKFLETILKRKNYIN